MEDRRVFCGWLQLDIKPFKHTLMNVIKRWSWMFKEHLLNHVNQSVRELSSFVQDTAQGLSKKVSDGDYAGLVDTMGHLMAIRDRQISNEQHFKPLKSTAELLKTYGQQLPESVYTQLEVCTITQIHTFPWILAEYVSLLYILHLITTKHRSCQRSGRVSGKLPSRSNMKWRLYSQMKFQLYAGNVSGLR